MKRHRMLLLSAVIGLMGAPAWADPPSDLQVFTTSGSFTVPAGVTKIEVEVRGGGGGGGGGMTATSSIPGRGGCGGGYGKGVFSVIEGSTHTVTVGAGGSGGSSAPSAGVAGGTSSFGTLISATGGGGGTTGTSGGCAGGTSTAPLNMTGFIGHQYATPAQITISSNRGGAAGDGSSRGSGGSGNKGAGSAGAAGNVVVRW